jgi:hypothetical protein
MLFLHPPPRALAAAGRIQPRPVSYRATRGDTDAGRGARSLTRARTRRHRGVGARGGAHAHVSRARRPPARRGRASLLWRLRGRRRRRGGIPGRTLEPFLVRGPSSLWRAPAPPPFPTVLPTVPPTVASSLFPTPVAHSRRRPMRSDRLRRPRPSRARLWPRRDVSS